MTPTCFQDLRNYRDLSLHNRQLVETATGVMPSEMWKLGAATFEYVSSLPDRELQHIRRHTYHITGDNYLNYVYFKRTTRSRHLKDYEFLAERLQCLPTESDSGIGFDFGTGAQAYDDISRMQGTVPSLSSERPRVRVSWDLLRYMQVCDDLQSSQLLTRTLTGNVLEIGGGYGGLASVVHQYNPQLSYVIVDLEETQFLQASFLALRFGHQRLRLCPEGLPLGDLEPGVFYLVPQHCAESVLHCSFLFGINQQSMHEMSEDQVVRYSGIIRQCCNRFYSCNRDSHHKRFSDSMGLVTTLGELLQEQLGVAVWTSRRSQWQALDKFLQYVSTQRVTTFTDRKLPRSVYPCRVSSQSRNQSDISTLGHGQ